MLPHTIGFIGAGQMARALAQGFTTAASPGPQVAASIGSGLGGLAGHGGPLLSGQQIVACDPAPEAAQAFAKAVPGATLAATNAEVVRRANVVFIAVKPQSMPAVFAELAGRIGRDKLVVSIAAGVTLARLSEGLKTDRIVRVMPNTPALVGCGASAYALGLGATAGDGELVGKLLAAVGRAVPVHEKLLDAVTGLSGSGPAFVYVMIEALSDGGVRMGLPRDVATLLAAQTVRGAAEMVLATGEHPAVLKDKVASPGGTTIAGLAALEARGARYAFIAAVEAAALRSQELGTG